jgi:hypothetical protein
MDTKAIAATAGATLLALTGTASAGPMNEMSAAALMPLQMLTEAIAYHPRFHHYGWHHGWHYGWYRGKYHRYAWYDDTYNAWNPIAAASGAAVGLATLPFALATGSWPYYYGYPYYYYY